MFSWQTLALGVTDSDAGFVPIGIGHKGAEVTKHCTSIALHLADGAWFYRSGKSVISKESKLFRYMADSSYWLYLTHIPPVLLMQWLFLFLPAPALVKFTLGFLTTMLILLLATNYWLGAL